LALRNSRIKYVQYLSDDGHPLRHLTTARICTVRRPTPVAALSCAGQALRNQLLRLFTQVPATLLQPATDQRPVIAVTRGGETGGLLHFFLCLPFFHLMFCGEVIILNQYPVSQMLNDQL